MLRHRKKGEAEEEEAGKGEEMCSGKGQERQVGREGRISRKEKEKLVLHHESV